MGCLRIVAYAWAALYTIMAIGQNNPPIWRLTLLLFGWIPVIIMQSCSFIVNRGIKEWQKEFGSFAGNPDPKFLYTYEKSGIALNEADSELILGKDKAFKKYAFHDVREWEIKHFTPGRVEGGGLQGISAQVGEIYRAKANSGLFIRMKDIEYPHWSIIMDINQQNRWYEILNQKINRE